jgi:hypothetical protein
MTTPIKLLLSFLLLLFYQSLLLSQTPCVNSPIIKVQPQNKNVIVGEQTLIYVKDSVGQSYQWQINIGGGFTNLSDGNGIAGTLTPILLFETTSLAQDNSQYRCLLTNTCGTTISTTSTFSVKPSPKSAIAGTNPRYYCTGSNYTLTVPNISGADYQWLKNPRFQEIDSTLVIQNVVSKFDYTFDTNGVLYIATYNDFGINVNKYENGTWQSLGTGYLPFSGYPEFDLELDNNNVPYILYVDSNNSYKATVRKFENNNWVLVGSRAVSTGSAERFDLFFDLLNTPYIAFSDGGNGNKIIVKKFDLTWNSVGLNAVSSNYCGTPTLTTDGLNNLYVCYHDGNTYKAVVKRLVSNSWQLINSNNPIDSSSPLTLKIDKKGVLYLAYVYDYGKVVVKRFSNNIWENLGSFKKPLSYGRSFSLELDDADNVYFSYANSDGNLITSKLVNRNWENISTQSAWYFEGMFKIRKDGLLFIVIPKYANNMVLSSYNGDLVGNNSNTITGNSNDSYSVKIKTNYTVLSDNIVKTQNIISPAITEHPQSDSTMINSFITFQTKSTQQGDLTYQWQEDNINLSDNQDVNGSSTNSLRLLNVQTTKEGKLYKCIVTNVCGSDNSLSSIILKVVERPQGTIIKTGSTLLCSGEQINMSISPFVTGAKYEWIKNPSWQNSFSPISNAYMYYSQSIVSDSKGKIYMAYITFLNNVGYKANVKVMENGIWESVGNPNFALVSGINISIALDNYDIPYILYDEPNTYGEKITMMKFSSNNWEIVGEANLSPTSAVGGTKMYLDFDAKNVPHFAFIEQSWAGEKAIVVKYENDRWNRVGQTNPTGGGIGDMAFIIDNYGIPYIVFQDPTKSFRATTKRLINNVWETLSQFSVANTGVQDLTLCVDKNNAIYVGYADGEAFIRYIVLQKYQNNSWQYIYSILPGEVFEVNNIKVDASGSIYVLYKLLSQNKIYLKKLSGNIQYSLDKASISSNSCLYSCLALDKKGIPLVIINEFQGSVPQITVKKFDGLIVGANSPNYSTSQIGTYAARVINFEGAYANHLINEDVIYSIISGNWESPATWSGGKIPKATDKVVIDVSHIITVSANNNDLKNLTICNNGQLIYSNSTGKIRMK